MVRRCGGDRCARPGSQRLFVANPIDNRLDIIDFSNPSSLVLVNSIDLSVLYDGLSAP